jgi:DNA repair exonuclease SbcCD ATPase subunit
MTVTIEEKSLVLPVPERLVLHRFSLFDKTSTLSVDFAGGVLCVAGANGLGKSTFLAALNFALTGVVAEPGREFRGVEDYYRRVRAYSQSAFRGRIRPNDLEAAYIELTVRINDKRYRVRRGVLETAELRELEIRAVTDDHVLIGHNADL